MHFAELYNIVHYLYMSGQEIDFRYDGEARALYHWQYRRRYNSLRHQIHLGHKITPDVVPIIGLLNQGVFDWTTFNLRKVDREPIESLHYPGKSAHIDFMDSEYGRLTDEEMGIVCDAVFGRPFRPGKDRLFRANVEDLLDLGYTVFFAPLPNHPLHVRIVHQDQIINPRLLDTSRKTKERMLLAWRQVR